MSPRGHHGPRLSRVSGLRPYGHQCCWASHGHTKPPMGASAPRPVPRTPGWPPRGPSCSGYLRANLLQVPGDTCRLAQVCLHLPRHGWSGPASAGAWPTPRAKGEMGVPSPWGHRLWGGRGGWRWWSRKTCEPSSDSSAQVASLRPGHSPETTGREARPRRSLGRGQGAAWEVLEGHLDTCGGLRRLSLGRRRLEMQRPRPPAEPGQRPERGPQSDHPALTLRPATQCSAWPRAGPRLCRGVRSSGREGLWVGARE